MQYIPRSLQPLTVVLLTLAAAASSSAARTNHWVSTSSGNWTTLSNWSDSSFYPSGTGDVAYIDVDVLASVKLAVILDAPVTLGELHLRNRSIEVKALPATNSITFNTGVTGQRALFHCYERIVGNVGTCVINPPLYLVSDLLVQDDDYSLKFNSVSKISGNSSARVLTLSMNTPSQGDATLEMGDLSAFAGTTVVMRDADNGSGIYLGTATTRFPAGPVVLKSTAMTRFNVDFTDTVLDRITTQPGAHHYFRGTATLANSTHPATLLGEFTRLTLGDANSTPPVDRWPNAIGLPLAGTRIYLDGPAAASTLETVGALTYTNGCWVTAYNRGAGYETSLLPASLARVERGTLLVSSDNATYPLGSANCRVMFAQAPTLVNGLLPPHVLVAARGTTASDYAMPTLATHHATLGLQPAFYNLTNTFGTANQTVRVVTTAANLGGATVDCYALFAGSSSPDGNTVYNGTVRLHSGLLAITGSYNRHAASYVFGVDGNGEGLVYVPSSTVETRVNDGLTGPVSCIDLTKFGFGLLRLSGDNVNLRGSIRVNQGSLAIDATSGIRNTNDVWLTYGARLVATASAVNLGGLSSAPNATVQMVRTSPCTLTLMPSANSTHRFEGAIRQSGATVSNLTVRVAGFGAQVIAGTVDATLSVAGGATLALDGVASLRAVNVDADGTLRIDAASSVASLDASAAGTRLVVLPTAPLTVTGACAWPRTVALPAGAVARGTYPLVVATSCSGALPALDTSAASVPAGSAPMLVLEGSTLVLRVEPATGTCILVR